MVVAGGGSAVPDSGVIRAGDWGEGKRGARSGGKKRDEFLAAPKTL